MRNKKMNRTFRLMGYLLMSLMICGCNPGNQAESGSSSGRPEHSHGEGNHDHDHGHGDDHDHDHGHSHDNPPHGGTLFDWGGGAYHVEFTVDHDRKETIVYILGDDAKTPVAIRADKIQLIIDEPLTELELTAQPMEGEEAGMSSRFVGQHETLGIVREFSGTVSGMVEGTPYTGDFKELPHGHQP